MFLGGSALRAGRCHPDTMGQGRALSSKYRWVSRVQGHEMVGIATLSLLRI